MKEETPCTLNPALIPPAPVKAVVEGVERKERKVNNDTMRVFCTDMDGRKLYLNQ